MNGYKQGMEITAKSLVLAIVVAVHTSIATPALAQQPGGSAGLIEEIVVTARLREESAQDIGQSIRAMAQDEIERAGIVDFGDIARRTAGLDFTYRGPNSNEVSIRGVAKVVNQGALDILTSQPVVSQFVDEVPIQAATSRQRDISTFDMNRIEVLRGPQPTYFGEGSVGGTVRYFSNEPTLEAGLRGTLNAQLGSIENGGEAYTLQGVIDATLVPDQLGIRVVGFTRDDEGFIDNSITGTKDYNRTTDFVRVRLCTWHGMTMAVTGLPTMTAPTPPSASARSTRTGKTITRRTASPQTTTLARSR